MSGRSRLTIHSVEISNSGSREIFGIHLDAPEVGVYDDVFTLKISGWCVPRTVPPDAILIQHEDNVLATGELFPRHDVAAALQSAEYALFSGFSINLSVLGLPSRGMIKVVAKLSSGIRRIICFLEYELVMDILNDPARLRPLLVHSVGRSGSTLAMQLLQKHSQISIHDRYPFETQFAQYNLHAMRVIANCPSTHEQSAISEHVLSPTVVGFNYSFGYYEDLNDLFNEVYAPAEIIHRFDQIERFYRYRSASEQKDATYYAEKTGENPYIDAICDKITASRNIYLLRDPRDIMCSIISFNLKRNYRSFGANSVSSFAEHAMLINAALEALLASFVRNRSKSLLIKYEDLLGSPEDTISQIFEFLALETDDVTRKEALRLFEAPVAFDHATTLTPQQSVHRWTQDLDKRQQDTCAIVFERIINEFYRGSS